MLSLLISETVRAFWILFPAYAANCFPPFVKYLKKRHYMDFGKNLNGKRIFGEGKTWEGFSIGIVAGFLVGLLEAYLFPSLNAYAMQFGTTLPTMNVLIAFLIPVGALVGDLVKSFIKRRLGIERGAKFLFFDQLDLIVGTIAFTFMFIDYTLLMVVIMFVATYLIHRASSIIGYKLKVKREPW